jgi:hypothetical protein
VLWLLGAVIATYVLIVVKLVTFTCLVVRVVVPALAAVAVVGFLLGRGERAR